MKFGKWIVIAVVGAALLTGIALAPVVLAQGPANDNSPGYGIRAMVNSDIGFARRMGSGNAAGPMVGRAGLWGGPQSSLVTVVAEAVGIDRTELIAELQSGKTFAEVIADHGLTPDSVVDAFLTLRAEKLADLVTNGQLTQEQADAVLATMKANVTEHLNAPWSPGGPGQGGGPGFVDEDGDGVCDHAGSGQSAARSGRMRGRWTQQ